MPSSFPGMDPFIEAQDWAGFHSRFIPVLSDLLVPRVRPRYVVRVETRVYVESIIDDGGRVVRPDVAIVETRDAPERMPGPGDSSPSIAAVECRVPISEEREELFLRIEEKTTRAVIAILEVLSPANKLLGSTGRREYLRKRDEVLRSPAHLIELDLLRGGARLPTLEPLPEGDFYAFVHRRERRPRAEVYAWPLAHTLPSIPVPLGRGDADIALELQAAFAAVYERAGYDYALDYDRAIAPPLDEARTAWVREIIARRPR